MHTKYIFNIEDLASLPRPSGYLARLDLIKKSRPYILDEQIEEIDCAVCGVKDVNKVFYVKVPGIGIQPHRFSHYGSINGQIEQCNIKKEQLQKDLFGTNLENSCLRDILIYGNLTERLTSSAEIFTNLKGLVKATKNLIKSQKLEFDF